MEQDNRQQGNPQDGQGQQSQADYGSAAQANNISGESNIGQQNQQGGFGDSGASRSGGQQGSGLGGGQQQQFDQTGGQQGGSGGDRFADQIREHQEVVDESGQHVGTVDHVDGDRIKLARSDSSDGEHHYVSLSDVAGIEGDKIRLRQGGGGN